MIVFSIAHYATYPQDNSTYCGIL
ncbi:MAG: hypothetical protein ACD_41C00163G0006, partial [uncultured bacterium]